MGFLIMIITLLPKKEINTAGVASYKKETTPWNCKSVLWMDEKQSIVDCYWVIYAFLREAKITKDLSGSPGDCHMEQCINKLDK
jgi:hypothetical protein